MADLIYRGKMRDKSIVLLSGGLDSALSFMRATETTEVIFGLTFDYCQRAADQEISAAQSICQHFLIPHKVVSLPFFSELTTHPFFSNNVACPEPNLEQLDDKASAQSSAKAVWVPNRNGLLLNVAATLAESNNCKLLFVGFNKEEATTFPDNSADYIAAINSSFQFSTLNQVQVTAPTIAMNKIEIVRELITNNFPLELIWSCYNNEEKMCGRCESCMRLKRAALANDVLSSLSFDIGHRAQNA